MPHCEQSLSPKTSTSKEDRQQKNTRGLRFCTSTVSRRTTMCERSSVTTLAFTIVAEIFVMTVDMKPVKLDAKKFACVTNKSNSFVTLVSKPLEWLQRAAVLSDEVSFPESCFCTATQVTTKRKCTKTQLNEPQHELWSVPEPKPYSSSCNGSNCKKCRHLSDFETLQRVCKTRTSPL